MRWWLSSALIVGLVGCAGSLPRPVQEDAKRAGVALSELKGGRERYVAKCSGCHALYVPRDYDDAAWERQMEAMAERSRLGEGDLRAILVYLQVMNAAAANGDPPE